MTNMCIIVNWGNMGIVFALAKMDCSYYYMKLTVKVVWRKKLAHVQASIIAMSFANNSTLLCLQAYLYDDQ